MCTTKLKFEECSLFYVHDMSSPSSSFFYYKQEESDLHWFWPSLFSFLCQAFSEVVASNSGPARSLSWNANIVTPGQPTAVRRPRSTARPLGLVEAALPVDPDISELFWINPNFDVWLESSAGLIDSLQDLSFSIVAMPVWLWVLSKCLRIKLKAVKTYSCQPWGWVFSAIDVQTLSIGLSLAETPLLRAFAPTPPEFLLPAHS